MDETARIAPLRLSVFMTGDPARRLRQLAAEKSMNMNQVVRTAINIWGRLEEVLSSPDDVLFVHKADGTEKIIRFPL